MADIIYLDFEIHLRDQDRVLELQQNPPGETSLMPNGAKAIIRAPLGAAQEFGNSDNDGEALPLIAIGNLNNLTPGAIPSGPYIFSHWFMMDDPYTAVANFPMDAATFVRKSGGLFGIPFLFPETKRFYWRGTFHYDAALSDDDPDDPGTTRSPIMKRRFIDPCFGTGFGNVTDTGSAVISRAAARWPDTIGLIVGGTSMQREQRLAEYQSTPATNLGRMSWERLYIRLRFAGDGGPFWKAYAGSGPSDAAQLDITPSGQIAAYNITSSGGTLLATSQALDVGKWYKLDILFGCADGGSGFGSEDYAPPGAVYPGAHLRVFLNNSEEFNITPPASGFGTAGFHDRSVIGNGNGASRLMLDIGFWMNAEHPLALNGIDWLNGSRPVVIRGDSFDSDHADWTGNVQTLAQIPHDNNAATPVPAEALTSTTALAKVAIITDADRALRLEGLIGITGFIVCFFGHRGSVDGQIGYRLANGADVLALMGENGSDGVRAENGSQGAPSLSRMMYRPSPGELPADLSTILPIDLLRVKGNDAVLARTYMLHAVVEAIGTFGTEDYPASFDEELRMPIVHRGVHNSPYPRTPWATSVAPPLSPVIIKTGTYVGTGTEVALTFRAPVNLFFVRRKTGAAPASARWFSSLLGSVRAAIREPSGWLLPRFEMDPNYSMPTAEDAQSFQSVVRMAGTDTEVNAAGETYCYLALMDPGMRFLLNGAMWHANSSLPRVHQIIVPDFTPLAGIFANHQWGVNPNDALWYFKGPGHATNQLTSTAGTDIANGVAFGAGELTHVGIPGGESWVHMPFALFRNDDGSGHEGVVRVFGMGSYVGNGVSARDIIVFPISDRRPVWIMVSATGQITHYKDCEMPATESRFWNEPNTAQTTAITGGLVNGFTVGVALNTNAVTYHYLLVWGGEAAGNGGMSQCGEFVPVPPDRPPCIREEGDLDAPAPSGGCDPDPPEPPEPPDGDDPGPGDDPGDPGGGDDDIDTDLSTECEPFTKRLFNDALSRIGIGKRIQWLMVPTASAWSATTAYAVRDAVTQGGVTYYCILAHTNHVPPNATYWSTSTPSVDNTEEADLCKRHYARAIETTLRDCPWPFATRYAILTLLGGTTTAVVNRDWRYAYRQPSDCVFERRLAVTRDGAVDPTPPPFQLSFDSTGGRIFTNQASAQLEYTARPLCTAGVGDPLFVDALTWRLASLIAGPLTRVADVSKLCLEQYELKIARAMAVLRPGNPGARTTIDPLLLDPGTGALAANLAVVNRALIRIGAQTVANLDTEQSREAAAARLIFEEELRSVLRDYPWSFATRYTTPTLVDGSQSDPVNTDWTYAYRAPSDLVRIRRVATPTWMRSRSERDPEAFRLSSDATGALIYAHVDEGTFEYTARIPDCVLRADPLFRDAFAWRLAASLAPSLALVDPEATEQLGRGPQEMPKERTATTLQLRAKAADAAWRQYYLTIEKARIADANEKQDDSRDSDADWIRGRE